MKPLEKDKSLIQVINGFLDGDSEYYNTIQKRITQYVHAQRVIDPADRDEIISDIIGILFDNLKNRKFYGNNLIALEVYMYSIAKNTVSNFRRKAGRVELAPHISRTGVRIFKSADRHYVNQDLSSRILSSVGEKCRELLELKFYQNWSDQEIADHYGKTKNAISTAISRCVKKAQDLDFVQNEM